MAGVANVMVMVRRGRAGEALPDRNRHGDGIGSLTGGPPRSLPRPASGRVELVLDIGAGRGALTAPLLDAGARVIAVERHPGRATYLRERFAGRNVVVVESDALTMRLPQRSFRVVASPPYSVSTPLLRLLLAPGSRLTAADLVLQQAAARRFCGGDPRGAGRLDRRWNLRLGLPLPRRAFTPPPRVDSVVLVARRR